LHKGIGFAVLSNQLEPVRGDDFAEDSFSSYNIIVIFTFLTMFAATVFLAWQCLGNLSIFDSKPMAVPRFQTSSLQSGVERMMRSLPRPTLVQFFQRMPWSLMRPFAFLWNQ